MSIETFKKRKATKMKNFIEITCPLGGSDHKLFEQVINQGIDAHLEAFTMSKFSEKGNRLVLNFHVKELELLVRRLQELETESADQWAEDIKNLDSYQGEI